MHCYLNPNKSGARAMLEAFARGCAVHGQPCAIVEAKKLLPGPAVFYGVDRVTLPVYLEVVQSGRDYFYIDNGYFNSKWHGGTYYRITKNRLQHDGLAPSDGDRWRQLGIELSPWRSGGKVVLIAQQSPWWYEWHGTSIDEWTQRALDVAADWQTEVRGKPTTKALPPIDWPNIKAVIAHSSNTAIDGLIQGVPCLVDAWYAAAFSLAGDWHKGRLCYPANREAVFASLADNQWTVEQMATGHAWERLQNA
jgi:hypothetical protein